MATNSGSWVLVCASEPLQSMLVELVEQAGLEARPFHTPLEAVEWLNDDGSHIEHALLSPDHEWSAGLQELLDEDYPAIHLSLVA